MAKPTTGTFGALSGRNPVHQASVYVPPSYKGRVVAIKICGPGADEKRIREIGRFQPAGLDGEQIVFQSSKPFSVKLKSLRGQKKSRSFRRLWIKKSKHGKKRPTFRTIPSQQCV